MKLVASLRGLLVLVLSACSGGRPIGEYNQIMERADRIVFYKKVGEAFAQTKVVSDPAELRNLKAALRRNVEPEAPKQLSPDYKLEVYHDGQLAGTLLIDYHAQAPYAHFSSPQAQFGFRLPYGIGMSL